MRPFSSRSDPPTRGLFDGILARGRVHEATDDAAWLQAMLDFEAGLARAEARLGLVPAAEADAIVRACHPESFSVAALGRDAAGPANPAVPLVAALRALLDEPAASYVHFGATSQDMLDTAAMLVAWRALALVLDDLAGAADAAALLAERHRGAVMPARTLLQHALPTTFGLEAAGWLGGLDAASATLSRVRSTRLAVQFGGAAGTLAALGSGGDAVVLVLAQELGLAAPTGPWHTERTRIGELAGALGVAAGAIGKVALDIILLAQTEVAEVREGSPGRGRSSTLPHKRNPTAAIAALAGARQAPGLVGTLLAVMPQEHQRGAGGWHAEWLALRDLLAATGSAAAWLRDSLENLEVDVDRMRADVDITHGAILAERIALELSPSLGRSAAQQLVSNAGEEAGTKGLTLLEAVAARAEVHATLTPARLEALADPAGYLGSADVFISAALEAHARARTPAGR